jgi:hypothetical protein
VSFAECEDDITVVKKFGATPFPKDVVKVVQRDIPSAPFTPATVTVDVYQKWTTAAPIDYIFLYYHTNTFDNKCYGWGEVGETKTPFATIDITCDVLKPRAILEICVADDSSKNVLSELDDMAEIPECCDPPVFPPGTICYLIKINCISECLEVGNELPGTRRLSSTNTSTSSAQRGDIGGNRRRNYRGREL